MCGVRVQTINIYWASALCRALGLFHLPAHLTLTWKCMAWLRVNHLHLIEKEMGPREPQQCPTSKAERRNPSSCPGDRGSFQGKWWVANFFFKMALHSNGILWKLVRLVKQACWGQESTRPIWEGSCNSAPVCRCQAGLSIVGFFQRSWKSRLFKQNVQRGNKTYLEVGFGPRFLILMKCFSKRRQYCIGVTGSRFKLSGFTSQLGHLLLARDCG